MEALSNQEIRQFITDHFDDSELITFCFDYFPEVQNNFAAGMRKNEKAMDLINYCRNRQLMTNLLTNLRQERQTTYQQAFKPQESFFAPPTKAKPRDPKQIFISYSTKDAAPLATRLAKDLRASGHPVWIAPESIAPGEKWGKAIERGLQESGIFILLLTPQAVDSYWVNKEMDAAIRLHGRGQMRVLPLDVQACTPPLFWEEYQFISFRDGYKKGRAQLWGALAEQPVKSPVRRTATSPPAKPQFSVTPKVTESLSSQLQELPDWMKWGGIVVALLLVFGIGYAIFSGGGGGDDEPMVTIAVVEPTEEVVVAVVETPAQTPINTRVPATQLANTITPSPTFPPAYTAMPKPTNTPTSTLALILGIGSSDTRAKDGAVMMYVPAGEFMMGSEDGQDGEQPIHEVYVDVYWMDKTEVTTEMYAQCVADGDCRPPEVDASYTHDNYYGNADFDDYPVIEVSWDDAVTYCEWADARLPTEAEWEKAAGWDDGAQQSQVYSWGDDFDGTQVNFCDSNCSLDWKDDTVNDGYEDVAPVGSYPDGVSPYGALDMAGNVWEWTSSLYQPYPYDGDDGRENINSTDVRVLRGGSWFNNNFNVRAAIRFSDPAGRNSAAGFRCAQE